MDIYQYHWAHKYGVVLVYENKTRREMLAERVELRTDSMKLVRIEGKIAMGKDSHALEGYKDDEKSFEI